MATNVTTFNPAQLPAFARNRTSVSALTKALANSGGSGYPHRISIKGGVFRLISNGKEIASIEERYLDVAIVNAAEFVTRKFYGIAFEDGVATPPKCWSSNGLVPDGNSSEKQASACASCEQNIKGSGANDSKACRSQQRIAVVLANDLSGNVLQLEVPGKSLFGKEDNGNFPLKAYASWAKAQGYDPDMVVTRIKFDTAESHPKMFFKTMRYLSDDEFEVVEGQAKTTDAHDAVLLNLGDVTAAPAAKQLAASAPVAKEEEEAPAPKPKTKAKAKAVEPEEEEAPAVEPTVRKAAEAPALPARKALASVVANWDTDD